MAGRDRNPYERPAHESYRNVDAFLNRIQRAMIVDIDRSKGTCTVEFDSTPGERSGVNLPFYVHASVPGKRSKTAWSRFMPQVGDMVLVGFDSNSIVRIVGYDMLSYETITNIQNEEGKFGWNDLKSGEFDVKSSGGAYIRGEATGLLYLAGGMTSIQLDKKNQEIRKTAPTIKETSNMCSFRRGIVKRSPAPFMPEATAKATKGILPIPPGVPGAAIDPVLPDVYEFTVDLRGSVTPSSPISMPIAFLSIGNVMNPDLSTPAGDAYGVGPLAFEKFVINPVANARFFFRIYDSIPISDTPIGTPGPALGGTPVRPFELGIDQLGNTYINVGALALQGFNVWSSNGISLSGNKVCISGNVFLGGTPIPVVPGMPPTMNAGIANQPVVCGLLLQSLFSLAFAPAIAAAAACAGDPITTKAFAAAVGAAFAAIAPGMTATFSPSVFVAPIPLIGVIPPLSYFTL